MATTDSPPAAVQEAPIDSIQPGGGLCVSLERAWGRLRRAVLRRCFPAHVQRMAALRQGVCPGCKHDVIDSRDLKLIRNVCGYRFPPETDPYAWRDRIGLARPGLAEIVCFTALLAPIMVMFLGLGVWLTPWWLLPLAVLLPLWLFILAFFRDPERTIPSDADALISPADGVVTHLEEVDAADFPGGKAFRVSIFLSVFNVHVNRIPLSGKVTQVRYYPGEYLDAPPCGVRRSQRATVDRHRGRSSGLSGARQTGGRGHRPPHRMLAEARRRRARRRSLRHDQVRLANRRAGAGLDRGRGAGQGRRGGPRRKSGAAAPSSRGARNRPSPPLRHRRKCVAPRMKALPFHRASGYR